MKASPVQKSFDKSFSPPWLFHQISSLIPAPSRPLCDLSLLPPPLHSAILGQADFGRWTANVSGPEVVRTRGGWTSEGIKSEAALMLFMFGVWGGGGGGSGSFH